MIKHFELFMGRIGQIRDPRAVGDGQVINFTIAETPRIKKGDEWVDGVTTWTDCSIWDKKAESFAASGAIKQGALVMIYGERTSREVEAYTTAKGVEIPAGVRQSVLVHEIAVCITPTITVDGTSKRAYDSSGSAPASKGSSNKPAAAAPAASKDPFAEFSEPAEEKPAAAKPAAKAAESADPFADFALDADGDDEENPFNFGEEDANDLPL